MYSLGMEANANPMTENLATVAKMGYDGVEFAGNNYGGLTSDELKAALAANKLGCRSVHLQMKDIVPTLPYLKEAGVSYAIVASHPFSNMEEILECANGLNEAGKEAAKYGIKVGYHNHTQEFNKIGDKYMLELLIENTDPENVVFELDCGWATAAGIDAGAFLKQYKDRFVAIHVKENSKVIGPEKPRSPKDPSPFKLDENGRPIITEEMRKKMEERASWNCGTGQGIIDWKKIFAICHEIGIDLFVVEREADYGGLDRLTCLQNDVNWLKENL
jgi:sugar phosphate isomerase/epimerase